MCSACGIDTYSSWMVEPTGWVASAWWRSGWQSNAGRSEFLPSSVAEPARPPTATNVSQEVGRTHGGAIVLSCHSLDLDPSRCSIIHFLHMGTALMNVFDLINHSWLACAQVVAKNGKSTARRHSTRSGLRLDEPGRAIFAAALYGSVVGGTAAAGRPRRSWLRYRLGDVGNCDDPTRLRRGGRQRRTLRAFRFGTT